MRFEELVVARKDDPKGRTFIAHRVASIEAEGPGVVGDDALRFVSAPPRWWLDRQEALLRPEVGERAREYARAMAFVARLDARTPLPSANNPRFHHALFERMAGEPWVVTGEDRGLRCRGIEALGLEAPVLCDTTQGVLAEFLAEATAELLKPEPVVRVSPVVAAMPGPPAAARARLHDGVIAARAADGETSSAIVSTALHGRPADGWTRGPLTRRESAAPAGPTRPARATLGPRRRL